MDFFQIYAEHMKKPTPAKAFIKLIANATKRQESTVRMWLSKVQAPDELSKEVISKELNIPVEELFPTTNVSPT